MFFLLIMKQHREQFKVPDARLPKICQIYLFNLCEREADRIKHSVRAQDNQGSPRTLQSSWTNEFIIMFRYPISEFYFEFSEKWAVVQV